MRKNIITLEDGEDYDTSRKACHPFGFYHNDVMFNPRGEEARVIGVRGDNLYYRKKDGGIKKWNTQKLKKEGLIAEGFKLIKAARE